MSWISTRSRQRSAPTPPARTLDLVLDTEHAEFAGAPAAIDVMSGATVRFQRPGAVILKRDEP